MPNYNGWDCSYTRCGSNGSGTLSTLTVNGGQKPKFGDVIDIPVEFFDWYVNPWPHTNSNGVVNGVMRVIILNVYGETDWSYITQGFSAVNDHGHDHDLPTIDYVPFPTSWNTAICPVGCSQLSSALNNANPPYIPGDTLNSYGQYAWDGVGAISAIEFGEGVWGCSGANYSISGTGVLTLTQGCIHPLATNYNASALIDDGSCDFYGWKCQSINGHWKFGKECVEADHYRTHFKDTKSECDGGCLDRIDGSRGKHVSNLVSNASEEPYLEEKRLANSNKRRVNKDCSECKNKIGTSKFIDHSDIIAMDGVPHPNPNTSNVVNNSYGTPNYRDKLGHYLSVNHPAQDITDYVFEATSSNMGHLVYEFPHHYPIGHLYDFTTVPANSPWLTLGYAAANADPLAHIPYSSFVVDDTFAEYLGGYESGTPPMQTSIYSSLPPSNSTLPPKHGCCPGPSHNPGGTPAGLSYPGVFWFIDRLILMSPRGYLVNRGLLCNSSDPNRNHPNCPNFGGGEFARFKVWDDGSIYSVIGAIIHVQTVLRSITPLSFATLQFGDDLTTMHSKAEVYYNSILSWPYVGIAAQTEIMPCLTGVDIREAPIKLTKD
jgi:hypothetical protein